MTTTLAFLMLASLPIHAAEVATGQPGATSAPMSSPISFARTAVGYGVKTLLPVTYVTGDAGSTPRGTCELEARRGSGADVLLTLVALKDPRAQFGFYDRKIVIPGSAYPLRAGMHIEQVDGDRTTLDYDGTTLTVRDFTKDEDGPSVTEYQITVDALLARVSHVTANTYKGPKPEANAVTAAVGCDPPIG